MGEFRPSKPGERRGGRQKGTQNKATADIKEMVLGALQDVGGRQYLAARAIDSPGPFLTLVGKILPTQLTGENGAPIAVDFRWADATPEPPTIEIDADETTVVSFIVADETNDA
jgi:hypothetical protein